MTKDDVILAALAAGELNSLTPVQVQKLLFLIDKKAAREIGGPFFDFIPYHYGPFDSEIYKRLAELADKGFVEIIGTRYSRERSYRITDTGFQHGVKALSKTSPGVQDFIKKLSEFVRSLSFVQLVSAIYKAYPEMKANSVFRG